MTFCGFSTDGLVGLPPELFSEVIPAIELPSELKVTLHIFYQLRQQRGRPRRISRDALASDPVLTRSLRSLSRLRSPGDLLDEGLAAAVQRTTLLHVILPAAGAGHVVNWYLIHTAANRAWATEVRQRQTALAPNPTVATERPTLLALYEQNIGLVTPLLLDELREAAERYPAAWIEDAIREAVRANARSWRYIRKVLERWSTHGREDAPDYRARPIDVERYINGPYGHLFERGGKERNSR